MLDYSKSFIETQFPVSKISKESYKERKAGPNQTLTGIGKWWGRKPLILVRALMLGVLMPVSDNSTLDKEMFLKLLTMDDTGLWMRKIKNIPIGKIYSSLNAVERVKYFKSESSEKKPLLNDELTVEDKQYLQKLVFHRLSYDEKIIYCDRPENVTLSEKSIWDEINNHFETNVKSFQELIQELGKRRFGHILTIGDCFSGGGSIPFEAGRIGASVYASDLNPIAGLLTWSSINLLSLDAKQKEQLMKVQDDILNSVDKQIIEWEIETNKNGDRADYYLYCTETKCPECGWKVPLLPSLVVGKRMDSVIVELAENSTLREYDFVIHADCSSEQMKQADSNGTVKKGKLVCPHCNKEVPISSIRKDRREPNGEKVSGLRLWDANEFMPRHDDIYQERLYAIKWADGSKRWYAEPTIDDEQREKRVVELLSERFDEWQSNGYIPSMKIENGYNTDQPIRERGWQYWHHLFNPRQLLTNGLIVKAIIEKCYDDNDIVFSTLLLNRVLNFNAKLCRWNSARDFSADVYYNQALNTLMNYGTRGLTKLRDAWNTKIIQPSTEIINSNILIKDARTNTQNCDIWITDPPYADAVNYHELTEFFLAWDKTMLEKAFPDWYGDSKRVLAVKGVGKSFNESMIEIYSNLAVHMPDNGYQVVMFTHQDVKVWSELAMILWSSGLHVVSAWNIATETDASGLKAGNYVKGTVLLTLKKQKSNKMAFQDELYDEIKYEVKNIIDSMRDLDDKDDPDFTDADYLLASYAASLKVLTAYKEIEGIDVKYWLAQPRDSKEENPVEALINKAVRIAYDYLIPEGFDTSSWKDLKPEERFFIRGLELEINGSKKISSYQELARGFGVTDYKDMFAEFKANSTRLKTPSEYRMKFLGGEGFGSTLLRHLLVAINETTKTESTVEGRNYLKNAYQADNQYWYKKTLMVELLSFIAKIEYVDTMEHWHKHAYFAKILKEALKNEGV